MFIMSQDSLLHPFFIWQKFTLFTDRQITDDLIISKKLESQFYVYCFTGAVDNIKYIFQKEKKRLLLCSHFYSILRPSIRKVIDHHCP